MGLSAEAYARQLKQLLPRGILWRLEPDSWLSRLLLGIADELARIDERGEDLVDEWDPRTAVETLPEWERTLGLPDGCLPLATTTAGRQAAVAAKMVARGGQTAAYFVARAAGLGFPATVDEPAPDTWRLTVTLPDMSLVVDYVARAGTAVAGDRVASSSVPPLECVFNRIKPAHSVLWVAYTVAP